MRFQARPHILRFEVTLMCVRWSTLRTENFQPFQFDGSAPCRTPAGLLCCI